MSYKKWIKVWLYCLVMLLVVILFNSIVDPLNIFGHKNIFNKYQIGFNERLQKSLYLNFVSDRNYNSLLLGSSRSTYCNQKDFLDLNLYNFSFSGAYLEEYSQVINYSRQLNNRSIDTIILGLDFYTYNSYNTDKNEEFILEERSKLSVFFENYISIEMLKYSLINMKRSLTNKAGHRSYSRDNTVYTDIVDEAIVKERAEARSKQYYANFIENNNYDYLIKEIKRENSESVFIVFIPPLSQPFLEQISSDEKLYRLYLKWVWLLVDNFDKVYSFSIPGEWVDNYSKFTIDGDHFYPSVCKNIGLFITSDSVQSGKFEHGYLVTRDNFNEFAKIISGFEEKDN